MHKLVSQAMMKVINIHINCELSTGCDYQLLMISFNHIFSKVCQTNVRWRLQPKNFSIIDKKCIVNSFSVFFLTFLILLELKGETLFK